MTPGQVLGSLAMVSVTGVVLMGAIGRQDGGETADKVCISPGASAARLAGHRRRGKAC